MPDVAAQTADPARLAELPAITLRSGSHDDFHEGVCAMEMVSYLAHEPFSDSPDCCSAVIAAFVRPWNDGLPEDKRNELLKPILPRLIGTAGSAELEERRALMAADWLVRTHTPAWLRLAGLTKQADALAGLPEITAMSQVPSIRPAIEAARDDAAAAGDAAWDAAGTAAGTAAWAAAAAWDAAYAVAGAAASAGAAAAAWATVGAASGAALKPTQNALQVSALDLLNCMIDAVEVPA